MGSSSDAESDCCNWQRVWLDDGTADWFWAAAERYDIPVMIFVPFAVPKIGGIAERQPGLRLIVDHMGLNSVLRGKDLTPSVDAVIKLARQHTTARGRQMARRRLFSSGARALLRRANARRSWRRPAFEYQRAISSRSIAPLR